MLGATEMILYTIYGFVRTCTHFGSVRTLLASLCLGFEPCEGGFVAADPQDLAGNQDRGGAQQQQKPNQVGLWE